jgi:hypothetical protein
MEDQHDIQLRNYIGFMFNHKRFFIPTSIIMPCMLFYDIFQNDFYIFLSTFMSLFVLGWNFPGIAKFFYSRPIYFEDLDDNKSDKKIVKNKILYNIELSSKFKSRFIIFQQLLSSVAIALVAEYINMKYKTNKYNTMELLGLIGGLLSLLTKIIRMSGHLFLSLLYYLKKKEKEKLLLKFNL